MPQRAADAFIRARDGGARITRLAGIAVVVIASVTTGLAPVTSPVGAQTLQGALNLVGELQLTGPFGRIEKSDVWGWVDPATQIEYALVGERFNGAVYIIDVSNPAEPTLTKRIDFAPGFDLKTWGHYLYVVDGNGSGTDAVVYDIQDPTNPVKVGNFLSAHNIFIDERGYLYNALAGMRIFDLNPDPANPVELWAGGIEGHDATVVGNILYDFHGGTGTFIYDVTDPAQPAALGSLTEPNDDGITYHHSGWPSADGSYLYMADELARDPKPDILVYDIRNLSNWVRVDAFQDTASTVHNVLRLDDYLYVSYYVSGIRVFDVSNPQVLELVAEYDTSPFSGEGTFAGAWGVYPFAPSGYLYVSDMQRGLLVFEFVPPATLVAIAAFDARVVEDRVTLTWDIAHADGLTGFHVYRSRDPESGYRRLNDALLPAALGFAYEDRSAEAGTSYWYRIGAVDRDGEVLSLARRVDIPRARFALYAPYPNPFSPATTLPFELERESRVRIAVYDAGGRLVRTLLDETRPAGRHSVQWTGVDAPGDRVPSGVYFARLEVGAQSRSQRLVVVR